MVPVELTAPAQEEEADTRMFESAKAKLTERERQERERKQAIAVHNRCWTTALLPLCLLSRALKEHESTRQVLVLHGLAILSKAPHRVIGRAYNAYAATHGTSGAYARADCPSGPRAQHACSR